MGLAQDYTLLPFKGIYLKYLGNPDDVKTNIYPAPNLNNPFLGVHFTKTVHGDVKIGPTAIPVFWRENYRGFANMRLTELALSELKKYRKQAFINASKCLVHHIHNHFISMPAGIRAQLLNKKTKQLQMDFMLEKTQHSLHILNTVSPAFTCSFSFAEHLISKYLVCN